MKYNIPESLRRVYNTWRKLYIIRQLRKMTTWQCVHSLKRFTNDYCKNTAVQTVHKNKLLHNTHETSTAAQHLRADRIRAHHECRSDLAWLMSLSRHDCTVRTLEADVNKSDGNTPFTSNSSKRRSIRVQLRMCPSDDGWCLRSERSSDEESI